MQQRGPTPTIITNPIPIMTPSKAPTPTFIPETENHEPATIAYVTRRRREDELVREPPTKSRSRAVRSLIEEDIDVSRSAMLGGYERESNGEGTSSKSPANVKKPDARDEGVDKRLERLKELLVELKSQARAHTSLRTSSPFATRIQEETIPKKFLMSTMGPYNSTGNSRDHVINYSRPSWSCKPILMPCSTRYSQLP